jgi:hypothetical protein
MIVPFEQRWSQGGRDGGAAAAGVIDGTIAARRTPSRARFGWSVVEILRPTTTTTTAIDRSRCATRSRRRVVVETSRGCWWGAEVALHGLRLELAWQHVDTATRAGARRRPSSTASPRATACAASTVVDNSSIGYHQQVLPQLEATASTSST